MTGMLGKKVGMTRFFNESGNPVPATVIEAGPCTVTQVKTAEKDGYSAIQLGFIPLAEKRVTKPMMGHFKRVNAKPLRILREIRDFGDEVKEGAELKVDLFHEGERVKVTSLSKGRGFAGAMKRHGFGGGPKSHGQSDRQRSPGSVGQAAYPKRIFRGIKMAGHMGQERNTISNLQVLKVLPDQNLIVIKGSIPGGRNTIVEIRRS